MQSLEIMPDKQTNFSPFMFCEVCAYIKLISTTSNQTTVHKLLQTYYTILFFIF